MDARIIADPAEWAELIEELGGHPMQSWEWGSLKCKTGPWEARRLAFEQDGLTLGAAQVLVRSLPFPFRQSAYAPRGPFAREGMLEQVADACAEWCRENLSAVSLKIDPAVPELSLGPAWRPSEQILLAKTAVVDLIPDEEELFAAIPGKKARQYIRKAGRDGVTVRAGREDDLDAVLAIYHATAEADGFPLHEDSFYRSAFTELGEVGRLYVAEQEGEIQAFLWNVVTRVCAFELWGAVSEPGKRSRANYLLKWEAMKDAKASGTVSYDLNGLLNDGISDFKRLFCKEPVWWAGTFDRPLSPLYGAYDAALRLRRSMNSARAAQSDTSSER